MATLTNNKKTVKSAPTYNRKNGKVKAAFNIPAKTGAKQKVKHYIPAAIRPYLMKIGRDIDKYISLCHDLTTEPLLLGSYAGYIDNKDLNFKKDAAALSYYLTLTVSTLARYDFSKGFPAIPAKESGYIMEYLCTGFSADEYCTWSDFYDGLQTFEDMAFTAIGLCSIANGNKPGDFCYLAGRLQMALHITELARAVFHLYDKERAEIETKSKEDRTVKTNLSECGAGLPLDIAQRLYMQLLAFAAGNETNYKAGMSEAGTEFITVFTNRALAATFKGYITKYFPLLIKRVTGIEDVAKLEALFVDFVRDHGLYAKK